MLVKEEGERRTYKYESWKDFVEDYGFAWWNPYKDGVFEVTIEKLLKGKAYESVDKGKKKYVHIFFDSFRPDEEYFVRNDNPKDIDSFFVIFVNGLCDSPVYFSKEDAEKAYKEIKERGGIRPESERTGSLER